MRGQTFRRTVEREILSLGIGADPVDVAIRCYSMEASLTTMRVCLFSGCAALIWAGHSDREIFARIGEAVSAFRALERGPSAVKAFR
jgi:hypothetical protein